jgi:hypothetical protein
MQQMDVRASHSRAKDRPVFVNRRYTPEGMQCGVPALAWEGDVDHCLGRPKKTLNAASEMGTCQPVLAPTLAFGVYRTTSAASLPLNQYSGPGSRWTIARSAQCPTDFERDMLTASNSADSGRGQSSSSCLEPWSPHDYDTCTFKVWGYMNPSGNICGSSPDIFSACDNNLCQQVDSQHSNISWVSMRDPESESSATWYYMFLRIINKLRSLG